MLSKCDIKMICCTLGLCSRKIVRVSSAQNSVFCFHIQVSQFIEQKSMKCCIDGKICVLCLFIMQLFRLCRIGQGTVWFWILKCESVSSYFCYILCYKSSSFTPLHSYTCEFVRITDWTTYMCHVRYICHLDTQGSFWGKKNF